MNFEPKYNTNSGRNETVFWMILGPFLLVLTFLYGFSLILLSPFCLVYSVLSLLLFIRTRNMGYMIKFFMFFFFCVFFILLFFTGFGILSMITGGVSVIFMIWLFIMMGTREYKWRTSQLLELAALPVHEVNDGYTMRPMPAGTLEFKWPELLQFSKFIRRNLISVPYFEKEKIIFSLNHSRLKLISFSSNYIQDTWISFDNKGHVSVHISKVDYKLYKDKYAFDQLSNSLGSLYSEFFRLFQQNKEEEIVKRIDMIRI